MLAILASAGCSGDSGESGGPKPEAKSIRLEAHITATDKALTVQYTLTNQGSTMVVAFSGIPAKDSASIPKVDPNAAYVTVQDGIVQISKRIFALPKDADSAAPSWVRGVPLVGGEATSERFTVPLPLQGRSPYASFDQKPVTLPSPVKQVQFCIGTALHDQVASQPPNPSDSDTRLGYQNGAAAGKQLVTCAAPVTLPA